jgi:serine/threonine-protein kinase
VLVMVMELVKGSSLKRLLEIEHPPMLKAIDLMCQVLDALDFAHRRGVVHRDITPANIMINTDGAVKLMDFGLAKSQRDVQLTREGVAVGSVHYMSPEQVRGQQELDNRSDLYSAGAVLYEMLCRQRVFDATDGFAIMRAHVEKQPIPPVQLNRDIPPQLNDLVLRALAKDPIQRFRSAAEFRQGLERCRAEIDRARRAAAESKKMKTDTKGKAALAAVIEPVVEEQREEEAPKPKPPVRKVALFVTAALAGLALASVAFLATQQFTPVETEQVEAAEPEAAAPTPASVKRQETKKPSVSAVKKDASKAKRTRRPRPVQPDAPEWAQPSNPKPVINGLDP